MFTDSLKGQGLLSVRVPVDFADGLSVVQAMFSAFGGKVAPIFVRGGTDREGVNFGFGCGLGVDEGESILIFAALEGLALGVGLPGVLFTTSALTALDVFDEIGIRREQVLVSVDGPTVGGFGVVGVVSVGEVGVVADEINDDGIDGARCGVAVGELEALASGADGRGGRADGFEEVFRVVVDVLRGEFGAGGDRTFAEFSVGHERFLSFVGMKTGKL